jgi:hypothetical protein
MKLWQADFESAFKKQKKKPELAIFFYTWLLSA